ncbi:TPA: hypothetical protein EYP83_01410 [Candidatus Geothermarchaeota archaeon]|nr:hypothetical protein [Candidatus Geothermarchaeota archaeon]HIQ13718.1 hypothetical protein [Thermoprotei archaeon]
MQVGIEFNLDRDVGSLYVIAGLPGMGLSGKQAVDYLVKSLDVDKIGSIKCDFLNPPAISTLNGVVDDMPVELFNFYYTVKNDKNIILFTGNVQPLSAEWQHIMAKSVVDTLNGYDVSAIFTLAATPIEYYKYDVAVYGVATSRDFLNELISYGVIPMEGEGVISGMNGLIIGYAKQYRYRGAVLMAETFLRTSQDVIAPYALLKTISKILKLDMDLKELEERVNLFHREYLKYMKKEAPEKKDRGLGYIS